MLIPGLVSITFRQLNPQQIIDLTVQAGLKTIEWGGDIHVPHGDISQARAVAQWTTDVGLSISAYGSYYRPGTDNHTSFEQVLETAIALNAPMIRVWAGNKAPTEADESYRQQVYQEIRQIAEQAANHNIIISLEFHDNTLTATAKSAIHLINSVQHPNLKMYWQPPHRIPHDQRIESLISLMPWLTHVHVFHWHPDHPNTQVRYPLAQGKSIWKPYIDYLKSSKRDHALMLEFVENDDPAAFLEDARTLLNWLE